MVNRSKGFYNPKEAMDSKQREVYLDSNLRDIVGYAYHHCKVFTERFDSFGIKPSDILTINDLKKLPILKKSDLPALQKKDLPFGGLLSISVQQLRRIYVSPGPTYDPFGREADPWRMGEAFYSAGFRKGDVVQNAFSYHLTPAGTVFDEALGQLGCVVIPTGISNIENQIEVLKDLPVNGYIGPASFLLALIRKAEEMGYKPEIDIGYDVAYTTGDLLTDTMRKEIEEGHGIRVRQGYMTADTGSVAYECSEKSGMHLSTDVIVEILDPISKKPVSPGEIGEIVVTNFDKTYPLIRFATGDLSSINNNPCVCGRTAPRLKKILGRADESIKAKAMFIHPNQLREVVSRFPEVHGYRLIVNRIRDKDELSLQIEIISEEADREMLKAKIGSRFKEVMRLDAGIEFVPRGTLQPGHKNIEDRRNWE
jgi:phenylacetate-CoA ligase